MRWNCRWRSLCSLRPAALPSGFKRIRHYGLLSPALKTERMAIARAALNMPAASAPAREDAAEFLKRVAQIDATRCPHCALGRWRTLETLRPANASNTSNASNASNASKAGKDQV